MSNTEENSMEIKCVIWDLDNTVWNGILLEENVALKDGILEIIKELDERGILQSVASKNNYDDAAEKLKEFGLEQYFLYPQINWNMKSNSVKTIQKKLNIGIDTIAFVDDQIFEREEVKSELPEVTVIDSSDYKKILDMDIMNPKFITADSRRRRLMYLENEQRIEEEENFQGPKNEFLQQLNMRLTIKKAENDDLERAEELTRRTHQLNSTGIQYGFEELSSIMKDPKYELWVCELIDKFGSYGKIGLTLIEKSEECWTIKLLIMSCRTVSRGIGTVVLRAAINAAIADRKCLRAEYKKTNRNRQMYVVYKFARFEEVSRKGDIITLQCRDTELEEYPDYITVVEEFKNQDSESDTISDNNEKEGR